jgi:DNA-binding Lrp family transcriptional regulator
MGVKMATAYVLFTTGLGAETEVMNDMKMIVEIKEAHMVYGVYDIIARIEADTIEDLKNIISWKVRRLNRVRSTLTMITV